MKIFITGGTGFIGRHLIPRLLAKRHQVFALGRSPHSRSLLEKMGATPIEGDLRTVSTFSAHFRKMDIVIHLGAKFELWGYYKDFHEINVRASEDITGAAVYHQIKQLIYLSAAGVVKENKPLFDITEEYTATELPKDNYLKSKAIAEKRVKDAAGRMNLTVFRPPFVWGKQVPFIEKYRPLISRIGFPLIGKSGHQISTCHVENLVEAIMNAIDNPEKKGTYYISDGEPMPFKFFLKDLLLTHGLVAGKVRIPKSLAKIAALICEIVWSILPLRIAPPITNTMINLLADELTVIDKKIRRELNFKNRVEATEELRNRRY